MTLYVKNCKHGSEEETLVLHTIYLTYFVPLPVGSIQWNTADNVGTYDSLILVTKNLYARRTETLILFIEMITLSLRTDISV
jgi:hypothetical protein